MSMSIPRGSAAVSLSLAGVTGAGLGLSLVVLGNSSSDWVLGGVLVTSLIAAPIGAGWLSSRLLYSALFPLAVLVSIAIATVTDESLYYGLDTSSYVYDPMRFTIFHAAIYGGGTFVVFCVGWTSRRLVGRLLSHETTASNLTIAALVVACYSVCLSISLYVWAFDNEWSPLSGWSPLNVAMLLLGCIAVLAGAAIIWSNDRKGQWSLAGLGLSFLHLAISTTLGSLPSMAMLYGLGSISLVAVAIWNVRRWRGDKASRE